jgi:hypothetical protein
MCRESVRALDLSTPSSLSSGPFELILDRVEAGLAAVWAGEPTTHTVLWEDDFGVEHSSWVDATSTGLVQNLDLHASLLTGRGTLNPDFKNLPAIPASVVMLLSDRDDADGNAL